MALAVPAVEDLTSRSRPERPRVRLLGQLQAQHTVAPGNPDFARRLWIAELVMAPAACSCDELHHPFRVGLSDGIHWREPLVIVVVPRKDDIGTSNAGVNSKALEMQQAGRIERVSSRGRRTAQLYCVQGLAHPVGGLTGVVLLALDFVGG